MGPGAPAISSRRRRPWYPKGIPDFCRARNSRRRRAPVRRRPGRVHHVVLRFDTRNRASAQTLAPFSAARCTGMLPC